MDWTHCTEVEAVPGKMGGVPVVRGTRVQADAILENHRSGESIADIAYNFDLPQEQVTAVLAYAAQQSEEPAEVWDPEDCPYDYNDPAAVRAYWSSAKIIYRGRVIQQPKSED